MFSTKRFSSEHISCFSYYVDMKIRDMFCIVERKNTENYESLSNMTNKLLLQSIILIIAVQFIIHGNKKIIHKSLLYQIVPPSVNTCSVKLITFSVNSFVLCHFKLIFEILQFKSNNNKKSL